MLTLAPNGQKQEEITLGPGPQPTKPTWGKHLQTLPPAMAATAPSEQGADAA